MSAAAHFAQTYAEARAKFLFAAGGAGIEVQSHTHPLRGRDGELLAMDVARVGAADAPALLVLSSACHGVEGFCGSGVQHALLGDADFRRQAHEAGVAVLFIHGLNPHGFSWWRRVTHENVDLNRNFHDFSRPLPRNAGYDRIAQWLVPQDWPPTPEGEAAIAAFGAEVGERGLQTAISAGQYDHPEGLFFGGRAPTWSHLTLRQVLREHGQACRRLGWIDFHTGLGPSGHGELIFACKDDAGALQRARRWWGPEVTSIYDGSSTSALLSGMMWITAYEDCAQAEYTGIALEYGTLPLQQVILALRADHWLHRNEQAPQAQCDAIKQQIRDAFYVDTDAWKQQVVEQGVTAARRACAGLRGGTA